MAWLMENLGTIIVAVIVVAVLSLVSIRMVRNKKQGKSTCGCGCGGCGSHCEHSPMEEMVALMKYMVGHNAAHAKELADLAGKLQQMGGSYAYEQVMAAVSDFEKGNMRLSMVLASLEQK